LQTEPGLVSIAQSGCPNAVCASRYEFSRSVYDRARL
jgi:hypothetical protein